jgi:uncharacterized membrane protein
VVTPVPHPARVVHGIDLARVEAAIRAAEAGSSGEIRVAISRFYFWGNVRRAAEAAFARLHMDRTRHRNAVLLFIAPRLRRFAVVGDVGIHGHVTPAFWNDLADDLAAAFRAGERTVGLERAVALIGERLAQHFPPELDDRNELPDVVVVPPPT